MSIARGVIVFCITMTINAGAQTPAPDILYLTERVSFTTSDGVFGFAVGTPVQVIDRHGSMLTVKSGDSRFDIRADQVTADPQLGKALGQRDAAEQAAVARARDEEAKSDQAATEQSAAAKQTRDSRLTQLRKREALLQMQLERLHEDWKDLPQKNPKTSPNAYALHQEIRAVERELSDVRQQEKLARLESH